MTSKQAVKILQQMQKIVASLPLPLCNRIIDRYGRDPYLILISCLLSLRARDTVTYGPCVELFDQARTPQELLKIPRSALETMLHSVGFYRRKAAVIQEVSAYLLEHHAGTVPATEEALLALPGVGRKTANLVLYEAFNVQAICVDTHVYQLSRKLGWSSARSPEGVERDLQKLFPYKLWGSINITLVRFGQNRKRACALLDDTAAAEIKALCIR
jgi:endonuclease-3